MRKRKVAIRRPTREEAALRYANDKTVEYIDFLLHGLRICLAHGNTRSYMHLRHELAKTLMRRTELYDKYLAIDCKRQKRKRRLRFSGR